MAVPQRRTLQQMITALSIIANDLNDQYGIPPAPAGAGPAGGGGGTMPPAGLILGRAARVQPFPPAGPGGGGPVQPFPPAGPERSRRDSEASILSNLAAGPGGGGGVPAGSVNGFGDEAFRGGGRRRRTIRRRRGAAKNRNTTHYR